MAQTVRTRFAPSPTGYLHVGGARTALFNYLLANRLGGRFILRIEDTDQTRNIEAADRKLIDDLRWLGLHWDEGPDADGPGAPYFQSQRLDKYRAAVRRLLDDGNAYYAFDTREELDALRTAAQSDPRGFRYPRPERFPSEQEAEDARADGRPVVVRLKMPEHDFVVHDDILGDVVYQRTELDDFVIQKSDGWPTYHLAVVVDDADMQVTHIVRGREHLANTPKHLALQELLGLPTPNYAHLPLIFNLDGSKMSKRDKDKAVRNSYQEAVKGGGIDSTRALALAGCDADAFAAWERKDIQLPAAGLEALARELSVTLPEIDVHDFRKSGYLPETLVNFLALLGWSAGDDREKYTLDELCGVFAIERVNKTDAKFDREKLLSFNTDACAAATPERLLEAMRDYLSLNPTSPLANLDDATLSRVIALCAGFRTFPDVEAKAGAMFAADDALQYDADAVKKWLLKGDNAGAKILADLRAALADGAEWTVTGLEAVIRTYAEENSLGLGKVAQPLRIAATGGTISPAIFDTLEMIGREHMLARIDRLLAHVSA